jgi:hypothetical protein
MDILAVIIVRLLLLFAAALPAGEEVTMPAGIR